ncbi:MAG TPA: hypothetical protein VFC46_05515 [Humisphaera sp.]|nr:hypothetical protein [Humisphaera sp.]
MTEAKTPGQYVYVVCASEDNYIAEMAAVSMTSLRITSPNARIMALTDRPTSLMSTPGITAVRATADELVTVDCPGENPIVRSRFLKCSMRELVSGPFLYLDSDTLMMQSPDTIWSIGCDIAASPAIGSDRKAFAASAADPEACAALGWTFGARQYLNSGVIYFADSAAARTIGDQYLAAWTQFQQVIGRANEEVAFNRAVEMAGANLVILPWSYNAQISMNVLTLRGAKIIHFFTGDFEASIETIAHTVAKRLKHNGELDVAAIRSAIQSGNPWTQIDSYRKAIATRSYSSIGKISFDRLTNRSASPVNRQYG